MKQDWQIELSHAVTDLPNLLQQLGLENSSLLIKPEQFNGFNLRVPRPYLNRIKPRDPKDPLLLQVLPTRQETDSISGFVSDPVSEKEFVKVPGLLHKYHGRVLLTTTSACAINCRYCFRRHFPYQDNSLSSQHTAAIIDYIKKNQSIFEVILSGGDPLVLKDEKIIQLVLELEKIPHVKYLRFHTRLPIMIPSRITDKLCQALCQTRLNTSVVIHCNHPNEIDSCVKSALNKLKTHGVMLLNQSVVLKGVNDEADTLIALSHTLFEAGVLPYYLHLLDPVAGAAHFDVPETKALQLIQSLQESLPGYLVPKLVREQAGEKHKTLILPTST